MKKIVLYIIGGILFPLACALAGRSVLNHLISWIAVENVTIVFTRLPEVFFLEVKFMVNFGLMGAILFVGTTIPKSFNPYFRFLLIVVPMVATCAFLISRKKALLSKITTMTDSSIPLVISVSSLNMEIIPLAAVATTAIMTFLLFIANYTMMTFCRKK